LQPDITYTLIRRTYDTISSEIPSKFPKFTEQRNRHFMSYAMMLMKYCSQ